MSSSSTSGRSTQIREAASIGDHRRGVNGRHVAVATQQARHARTIKRGFGKVGVERRKFERAVGEDLDRLAPGPDGDHGSEGRIVGDADQQFDGAFALDHRFDVETVDARRRVRSRDPLRDLSRRGGGGRRVGEIEPHAAHVGLVREVGTDELYGERRAQAGARLRHRLGVAREAAFRDRDPEGLDDRLGLAGGQRRSPLGMCAGDDRRRPRLVRGRERRCGPRRAAPGRGRSHARSPG